MGDSLALMDRNSLLSDWRPVFVVRKEAELWVLLDANRELLDELADGCPAAGFHTNDLVRDIGTDFYKVPEFGAQAGDDKAHDLDGMELDLVRVRLTGSGATGTLRTRDGSGDTAIPAHKVAFLDDAGGGQHVLFKTDDVHKHVAVLKVEEDPTLPAERAVRLLRGGATTKSEGTLIGNITL